MVHSSAQNSLVSVIVPTYQQAAYLPACLDSLLHQTYRPLEIIVINDASPDDTSSVMESYFKELDSTRAIAVGNKNGEVIRQSIRRYPQPVPEIHYLENLTNLGATKSYARAFEQAKGEFVTHIPSDDFVTPHFLEELVLSLKSGADFAYSDFLLVDDAQRILLEYRLPDYDFKTCLADWFRLGSSYLFRRELFVESGGFDESYQLANDYDLFLRFAMRGAAFAHVSRFLYYKRSHDTRRLGQWAPDRYPVLIEESVKCAQRARDYLDNEQP